MSTGSQNGYFRGLQKIDFLHDQRSSSIINIQYMSKRIVLPEKPLIIYKARSQARVYTLFYFTGNTRNQIRQDLFQEVLYLKT